MTCPGCSAAVSLDEGAELVGAWCECGDHEGDHADAGCLVCGCPEFEGRTDPACPGCGAALDAGQAGVAPAPFAA